MRKFLLIALVSFSVLHVSAQSAKKSTKKSKTKATTASAKVTPMKWDFGGMATLAATQTGSRNWAPGGDRFSVSGNGFVNLWANASKNKCFWDNNLQLNYGVQSNKAYGVVKNDDRIDFTSDFSHSISKKNPAFRVGLLANLRTQAFKGYDFDNGKTLISKFFAPAYAVGSLGFEYRKSGFMAHVGGGGRWVIVSNHPNELAPKYGVNPTQKVKNEAGVFARLAYTKEVLKNVTYSGRFDVFGDFVGKSPGNADFFFTNMLYLKVNKYLGVVYNLDLQYDDDARMFGYNKDKARLQLKSIFGIGVTAKF